LRIRAISLSNIGNCQNSTSCIPFEDCIAGVLFLHLCNGLVTREKDERNSADMAETRKRLGNGCASQHEHVLLEDEFVNCQKAVRREQDEELRELSESLDERRRWEEAFNTG
jgi:hypothetical protein